MLKKFRELDGWTKAVVLLLFGGGLIGKASAYIGLAFGGLLLLSTRLLWDRWFLSLTRRQHPLNEISWPFLISLLYGFAQVINGVLQGYPLRTALQILIFNINPAYIFLGVWVGSRYPGIVRVYIRFLAWYVVIYAPLYFLVLNKLTLTIGGADSGLSILGNPGTGSVTLLGLLAYEPELAGFWLPIVVLTCLTIANQERADWMGLGLALMVWGKLARKMNRVLIVLGAIGVVLAIAAMIDLKLPPIPGRGGELSARGTVARMAGAFSADLAEQVGGDRGDAQFYYGTVYWRKHWWAQIRNEVSRDYPTLIFGLGYGYPLANLTGDAGTVQEGTRSPHSIFYFALGYSGIVGVVIFFWLEFAVLFVLYRVYKVTGQIFGLSYFLYSVSGAFFGNFLETPAGISFYLIIGLCIGPMIRELEMDHHAPLDAPSQVAEFV